jgi:2,4-dienoyl-CoA reductase-like NADH-dependent reductase (Old Yellow Enzyme family)/thioredoxin reductase
MAELKHLLSPIKIRGLEIPNRTVMPPMGTGLNNRDETVSEANLAYLKRMSSGGIGLVIIEVLGVHPTGCVGLGIHDDRFIPGLKKAVDTVHESGAKIAFQLHHAGREAARQLQKGEAIAPSAIPSRVYGVPAREMTKADIEELIEAFGSAAKRAQAAGADAVELHAAHGYFLMQFLSAISNQREDEYGGSFQNRARFVIEVIESVRANVGPDFPIFIRISTEEFIKNGYVVEDMQTIVPDFVKAGVDVIHASIGTHGSPGAVTQASPEYEPGWTVGRAMKIKEVVDIPVIAVGRFTDPRLADEVIGRGEADMVAFGRQQLADPDFIKKVKEGRPEDIRACIACNQGCIERLMLEPGSSVRCAINPETGQELIYPRKPAEESKNVWVIGAGPSGLTAASEAARLGHKVTLFEKESGIGGQIEYASKAPFKKIYWDWIDWLANQVKKAGVDIKLNTEVTEEMLKPGAADVVILAVGGDKIVPQIPGVDEALVCDAWQALSGDVAPGKNVVVVGGGLIGMETSDYLADKGSKITLVEMLESSPVTKASTHGYFLHRRLRDAACQFLFNAELKSIQPDSITISSGGEETTISPIDQVVMAVGMKPRETLKKWLQESGIRHYIVGDAVQVRRIVEATEEGAKAAWSI